MVDFKALVNEVSGLEATAEEKVAALAAASVELGFEDHLRSVRAIEKTAAVSKKIAGREVTFSKMSFEDIMAHLTSQYSVPADHDVEEKTASAPKTQREKLASLVAAELAKSS